MKPSALALTLLLSAAPANAEGFVESLLPNSQPWTQCRGEGADYRNAIDACTAMLKAPGSVPAVRATILLARGRQSYFVAREELANPWRRVGFWCGQILIFAGFGQFEAGFLAN